MTTKILFLIVVVAACFIDFQLALILTIALLVFVIHTNNAFISKASMKTGVASKDTFVNQTMNSKINSKDANEQLGAYFVQPVLPKVKDHTKNIVCDQPKVNDMNKQLLNIYVDQKIKPYEIYVAMMTNEEQLAKAQGSLV